MKGRSCDRAGLQCRFGCISSRHSLLQVTSHPFLCEGIEEDFTLDRAGKDDELQRLIASSGKMLLLAKLLPKLRAEGHKVPTMLRHYAAQSRGCRVLVWNWIPARATSRFLKAHEKSIGPDGDELRPAFDVV